ncbi:hypothetical protein BDP27DRAFT_1419506 [Rhodocollybia butyracea]|uniref:Uncharacterized protein n=1 Tax=Rhodocollybia butyracea TaxID=206335 RepID=A0A9P5PXC4_9AGAR|nr:hypothetical protein BDP27DRAFT_1419506 [Rhodocollybia butyracea]
MPRIIKARKKSQDCSDAISSWFSRVNDSLKEEFDPFLTLLPPAVGPTLQLQMEKPINDTIPPCRSLVSTMKSYISPENTTSDSVPSPPQKANDEMLREVQGVRLLLQEISRSQQELRSSFNSWTVPRIPSFLPSSGSQVLPDPSQPSFLKTYSLTIGGNKVLSYTSKDVPDKPPCMKRYTDPVSYMWRLWSNWDDEDEHWDGTMHASEDYIIKGTKIAMRYWPLAIHPWCNSVRTQWRKYNILMEESRKFSSIENFLLAHPGPNGQPLTLTKIAEKVNKEAKDANPKPRESLRKKRAIPSQIISSQQRLSSGPPVSYSSQPGLFYCGVLVRRFNFEGVDISNPDEVSSVARAFVHELGCVGREFRAAMYSGSLFLMWKHKPDAEAFVNVFHSPPAPYQNLEITPYFLK